MDTEYKITAIETEDGRMADGVIVNQDGAWLGELDHYAGDGAETIQPLCDEDGDYLPAPVGWEARVVEAVA